MDYHGIFVTFMVVLAFLAAMSIGEKRSSNRTPKLTINALVLGKGINTPEHSKGDRISSEREQSTTDRLYTTYHATFRLESEDQMTFPISASTYRSIVAGDYGKLTFKGNRFISFEVTS